MAFLELGISYSQDLSLSKFQAQGAATAKSQPHRSATVAFTGVSI
jgi:hypothetical protein